MNIHDLSRRTHISLANLRKLERLDVLKLDEETPLAAPLRLHLGRNQRMTVAQMLALIDEPATLDELGKYEARARAQLATLGDVKATAAPRSVTAEIVEASKGNPEACRALANWLKAILPSEPVPYHWVAVRLLAPLNEFLRETNAPLINLALLKVRGLPEFAGWWKSVPIAGRNTIVFQKAKIALDL